MVTSEYFESEPSEEWVDDGPDRSLAGVTPIVAVEGSASGAGRRAVSSSISRSDTNLERETVWSLSMKFERVPSTRRKVSSL